MITLTRRIAQLKEQIQSKLRTKKIFRNKARIARNREIIIRLRTWIINYELNKMIKALQKTADKAEQAAASMRIGYIDEDKLDEQGKIKPPYTSLRERFNKCAFFDSALPAIDFALMTTPQGYPENNHMLDAQEYAVRAFWPPKKKKYEVVVTGLEIVGLTTLKPGDTITIHIAED